MWLKATLGSRPEPTCLDISDGLSVITENTLVTLNCCIFSLENCGKKEADGSMSSNL